MRVPPLQSTTFPATRAKAASGSRTRSSRVMRVNRVPNTNTSTGAPPPERASACANRSRKRL